MSKSIKTRDIIKDVKSIDKALIAGEHIRNISAKTKEHIEENTHSQYVGPDDYAINKINENFEHFINRTSIEAKIQTQKGYRFVKERRKRKKIYIDNEINRATSSNKVKIKEPTQKNIKTSVSKTKKDVKTAKQNIKNTSKTTIKTSQELTKQSAIKSKQISKESYHTIKTIGRKSWTVSKKELVLSKQLSIQPEHHLLFFIQLAGLQFLSYY